MVILASYADILWARHAIFLPHVGEEDCVTSPKNVCVGGYGDASSATVRGVVSFYVVATDGTSSSSARTTTIHKGKFNVPRSGDEHNGLFKTL